MTRPDRGAPSPTRVPKGWAPEVWRLRCALLAARERLPYASANARLLDGVERWVKLQGRGKAPAGPWWATCCALAKAAAWATDDPATQAILAPWAGLVDVAPVAGSGFRPLGG
jgi:hypothetical protein